ncbi:MAG: DUF3810 domain-containing protein [Bacteroidetes bacterium]|nr:DUF3810 domain-containing protein [Bacteroidota bacterium]
MKSWSWILLVILAILIKWASMNPLWIETNYTYGLYPLISKTLRFLFGWLPFSIGDLFYSFLILVIIYKTYQFLKNLFQKKINRQYLLSGLQQLIFFFLFVYVFFYLLWGLNYSRMGIASQLNLKVKTYSLGELDTLTTVLQNRMNDYAAHIDFKQRDSLAKKQQLFSESVAAYANVAEQYDFLQYKPESIKPSIFSYAGNILGFEGYYNPFSGEGQVNTTIPLFMQPFVACHEMAHQLGYAKENEANFVGYLACRSHSSVTFKYSVYFDLYSYAISEVYRRDTSLAKQFQQKLHPQVKKDMDQWRRFYTQYKNPVEPIIMWAYGHYLKANNQPAGKLTYNEVVAWLIAYQHKFGIESI